MQRSCEITRLILIATLVACWILACYPSGSTAAESASAGQDTVFLRLKPGTYPIDRHRRTMDVAPSEDHLFLFATIADSHIKITNSDDPRYIKALSIAPELLACYVEDINAHEPPVDFVVHLGDITDLALPAEFDTSRAIMDSLDCPMYPVVGNHDNFQSDNKELWKQFAGLDTTNYTFDYFGFHFVVIDCTLDPYVTPYVTCDSALISWVAEDLYLNPSKPTFILSHYNMWERGWNAKFDTTQHYAEYEGMPALKQVLEDAGNVVAVINGHVHANRAEEHNGIYYLDVSATLVGPPSIRYFYVFPDRVEVTYAYISDDSLYSHVTALCEECRSCFNPLEVCDYVDGEESDRQLTMPFDASSVAHRGEDLSVRFEFDLRMSSQGRIEALIDSDMVGRLEISLYDVLGRLSDRCTVEKHASEVVIDLNEALPNLESLGHEVYFVRARLGDRALTRKIPLLKR